MKFIQFVLLGISIIFTFTVLHNNLVDDAQSFVTNDLKLLNVQHVDAGVQKVNLNNEIKTQQEKFKNVDQDLSPQKKNVIIYGKLDHGDTFNSALQRDNVPSEIRTFIISSLTDTLDFKRLKPFDTYTLQLSDSGQLDSFRYQSGPLDSVSITNSFDGYKVQKDPIALERRRVCISGEINSSLFASFTDKNEHIRLVYAFADIFASKIDFNTEVQRGDRYTFVVDKYYKNGALVGYGKIQSARYDFKNGMSLKAYYFTPANEKLGSYFNETGQAVGTSFLRSPLPFGRISSRFSHKRKHPITGVVKPHLGIDLAAPRGTPVMAAADGTISFIGDSMSCY